MYLCTQVAVDHLVNPVALLGGGVEESMVFWVPFLLTHSAQLGSNACGMIGCRESLQSVLNGSRQQLVKSVGELRSFLQHTHCISYSRNRVAK